MPRPFNPLGQLQQAFRQQRAAAADRGIEWNFDFASWLLVWQQSGHLDQRGRGVGRYCMARFGDTGPYAPGNVRICLQEENTSEAFQTKPYVERRGRIGGPTGLGGGKGVYRRTDRPRAKPFQALFRGKFLGSFATEQEGRAAYEAAAKAYLSSIGKSLEATQ